MIAYRKVVAPLLLLSAISVSERGLVARQPPVAGVLPYVRALAFSPDGKLLIAGYGTSKDEHGGVRAWDIATQRQVWQRLEPAWVPSLSFAPDGRSLAIANGKKTALRLDPSTGKELGEVGPHPAAVRAVAFVPGTDLLATAHESVILLWEVGSGIIQRPLVGHTKEVRSFEVSPDGRWLISSGQDSRRYWNVTAGTEIKDVARHTRSYAFIAANQVLITNEGFDFRVIEFPDGKASSRIPSANLSDRSAYTEKAKLVAFYGIGSPYISIFNFTMTAPDAAEKGRIEHLINQFDDDSNEIRVSASAKMREIGFIAEPLLREAMTKGPTVEVRMRAREARQSLLDDPLRRLSGFVGDIFSIVFSPDGKLLAAGGEDGVVHVWDTQTGREIARFSTNSGSSRP